MQGSAAVVFALFTALIPAQSKTVSRMAMQRHEDVCMGLSTAECCAQALEIAVFRATGDQVPKAAKTPVRLSCAEPTAVVPEGACRSIAVGRGFGVKDIGELCAAPKLAKRCAADATCKSCVNDLSKLKFQGAERACVAATYVVTDAADGGMGVIVLHDEPAGAEGVSAEGNRIEIRRRRAVVR